MSGNTWIAVGAVLGGLGVIAGAFGAHGLETFFAEHSGERLEQIYETAVRYQMYHALALVLTGIMARTQSSVCTKIAGSSFTLGVLMFSGLLYALALTGKQIHWSLIPIGGVLLIIGWFALAIASFTGQRAP